MISAYLATIGFAIFLESVPDEGSATVNSFAEEPVILDLDAYKRQDVLDPSPGPVFKSVSIMEWSVDYLLTDRLFKDIAKTRGEGAAAPTLEASRARAAELEERLAEAEERVIESDSSLASLVTAVEATKAEAALTEAVALPTTADRINDMSNGSDKRLTMPPEMSNTLMQDTSRHAIRDTAVAMVTDNSRAAAMETEVQITSYFQPCPLLFFLPCILAFLPLCLRRSTPSQSVAVVDTVPLSTKLQKISHDAVLP